MRNVRRLLAPLVAGVVLYATAATAQNYDLVILSGRVMDLETMYDDIANVGVKGGKIYTNTVN